MYATESQYCPVKMLQLLIAKTDPSANKLFNQYVRDVSADRDIWSTDKPLSKRTFTTFMGDICKGANVSKKYTAHCLRATAIQGMNDLGFEARHIMFLSDHKSESAIRSYNRSCSTAQRKTFSTALSAIANGTSSSRVDNVDQLSITAPGVRSTLGQCLLPTSTVSKNPSPGGKQLSITESAQSGMSPPLSSMSTPCGEQLLNAECSPAFPMARPDIHNVKSRQRKNYDDTGLLVNKHVVSYIIRISNKQRVPRLHFQF